MRLNGLATYAWAVLAYNVGVILWGAYVRATGSGAGCGQHWPLCNGEVVPQDPRVDTLVEFSHRLSSGLALVLVLALAVWVFRARPRGHTLRQGAALSVVFIFTEALIGAGLVLFQLVADNASVARAAFISLHLVNTFLLLGALTLTAWWASGGAPLRPMGQKPLAAAFLAGMIGTTLIGASGAIVALGDTLFPAESLASGLRQDFDPTMSFLVRLRVLHPIIAIVVGIGLIVLSSHARQSVASRGASRASKGLALLVLVQWLAGMVNLALLAPVWMQLVHLLLADLVWIVLVVLAATVLGEAKGAPAPSSNRIGGRRLVRR